MLLVQGFQRDPLSADPGRVSGQGVADRLTGVMAPKTRGSKPSCVFQQGPCSFSLAQLWVLLSPGRIAPNGRSVAYFKSDTRTQTFDTQTPMDYDHPCSSHSSLCMYSGSFGVAILKIFGLCSTSTQCKWCFSSMCSAN